ncbi:MAG TPA: sugar transferase [Actinomycetota bacterium]
MKNRAAPVRVLFLDHVPRMSGAEQSLADLVIGLQRGPIEPVVALPSDGPLATHLRAHGVLVRNVPMSRSLLETSRATLSRSPFTAIARLGAFLVASYRIWRLIRQVRPAVVHTNTLKTHLLAIIPCFLRETPLVWHMRDILPKGWLRRAVALAASAASVIVVPSRAVAECFRSNRRVYRKLRLIPNGIRVADFAEAKRDKSMREAMGVTAKQPVVGIVGRVAPWKGQDVFLAAAAMLANRHPTAHFAVVGAVLFPENDVPFERQLHQMVAAHGLQERVTFLGWQPAPEAMASMDVIVHASKEPEPFGRTLVEAMAAGKPVVAAAGGAVQEIVPPSSGFIVPPGRPELLADALDRLLEDRTLRTRMGEAGRAVAESFFPVERTISSVAQIDAALAKRSARRRQRVQRMVPSWLRAARAKRPAPPVSVERPIAWPKIEAGVPDPMPFDEAARPPAAQTSRRIDFDLPPEGESVTIEIDDDDEPDRDVSAEPAATEQTPAEPAPAEPVLERPVAVRPNPVVAPEVTAARATVVRPRSQPHPARPKRSKRTAPLRRSAPRIAPAVTPPAPASRPSAAPWIESKPVYEFVKRAMDVAIALTVLILGLPLWTVIAIMIKLESPGTILFTGTVHGRGGAPFTYYKFRSMRRDGDDKAHRRFIERYVRENGGHEHEGEVIYKLMADDRVTAIGRFIRKLSLDEIPQLVNVLRGEMSIVGPRPPLTYEYELYDETAARRLAVRPGITGMQQVWFRHTASFEAKLALDMKYIQNRSTWLDIKLILHSFRAAISGH